MLGNESQHEIQFIIISHTDNSIGIGDPFLNEEVDIRTVAAYGNPLTQLIGHHAAPFAVLLNDFYLDALLIHHRSQETPCPAGTDNHDPFHFFRATGNKILTEFFNSLGITDKIRIIVRQEAIIAMRYDHAVIAENHPCQDGLGHVQVFQRYIGQMGMAADLRFKQPDLAIGKIFDIESRRHHEDAVDFTGRDHFRIEHEVNIKIFLQIILGFRHELHIPDTRRRIAYAMFLGKDAGNHIDFINSRHSDENIGIADIGIVHGDRTGTIGQNSQYIEIVFDSLQPFFILIDDDDVILFIR